MHISLASYVIQIVHPLLNSGSAPLRNVIIPAHHKICRCAYKSNAVWWQVNSY